ncbi:MAG: acyl-CoA synthetase [Betaproteobacteria bacterium]|nr:acyl-CoA synthetase [Betaproteobacteria bacterium]
MKAANAEWTRRRERGSGALLRAMIALSLRCGRRPTRVILYAIALYFFLFAPRARRSSRGYLRRALGRRPAARDRFRQVLYFATTIHDRVFLLNDRFHEFDISIEGEPLLREAIRAGRGGVLLGAHLGSFEVMRALGRHRAGLAVVMAMYEENARQLNAALAAICPDSPPEIEPLGDIGSMLRIGERLDEGAFVGFLADRTLAEEPVRRVPFLGAPADFPLGPMRAAAILRRPVIFMAGLYRGGNRYHLVFEAVADFSAVSRAERDACVAAAVDRYVGLLEKYCRLDPYDWFNFFEFWPPQAHDG